MPRQTTIERNKWKKRVCKNDDLKPYENDPKAVWKYNSKYTEYNSIYIETERKNNRRESWQPAHIFYYDSDVLVTGDNNTVFVFDKAAVERLRDLNKNKIRESSTTSRGFTINPISAASAAKKTIKIGK